MLDAIRVEHQVQEGRQELMYALPPGRFVSCSCFIGQREASEAELLLPFLTEYVQQVFAQTKTGIGQKWLMIEVSNTAVLEDVKQLIALRRSTKETVVRWV